MQGLGKGYAVVSRKLTLSSYLGSWSDYTLAISICTGKVNLPLTKWKELRFCGKNIYQDKTRGGFIKKL